MSFISKEEKPHLHVFLKRGKLSLKTYRQVYQKDRKSDIWKQFSLICLDCEIEELNADSFHFVTKRVGDYILVDGFVACVYCYTVYVYIVHCTMRKEVHQQLVSIHVKQSHHPDNCY